MRVGVAVDKAARKALANQTTADDQSADVVTTCARPCARMSSSKISRNLTA